MSTGAILLTLAGAVLGTLLALVLDPLLGRPVERGVLRMLSLVGGGTGQRDLDLTGIWHSIYTYTTSDGPNAYRGHHYVVVRQFRDRVAVRSLDHPEGSKLWMDLELDSGLVLTGTWRELTGRKLEYHGAIQMLVKPSRSELEGLWVGFGRSRSVKCDAWQMTRVSRTKRRRDRKRFTQKAAREFAISRSRQTGARVLGYPDEGGF